MCRTPPLNYDTILGFNEPNFGEQANMSPQEAAQYWIQASYCCLLLLLLYKIMKMAKVFWQRQKDIFLRQSREFTIYLFFL
jgi:hypothetical protein